MKPPQATGIARYLARNGPDEKRLLATGAKIGSICRADKGEAPGKFGMRKGEYLGVVDGLRAFGETKAEMVAAVKLVHSWDATIKDAETGLCSRRDGAEMMAAALGPKRPSKAYKAMQERSVRSRIKGRMPMREAQAIWNRADLSIDEKLALMRGWSKFTTYKAFGKTGIVSGRRPREQ